MLISIVMPAPRRMNKVKTLASGWTRRTKLSQPTLHASAGNSRALRLRLNVSSPYIGALTRPQFSFRQYSTARRFPSVDSLRQTRAVPRRGYASCNVGCPCPFPCGPCGCKGGCSCLPPPCNTPPKCLQYMTGYYYYPYGTWFCGPYHVSGTCVPMGANCPCPCPCPCPPKCCPACVCAPNFDPKNISDLNQFPLEVPGGVKVPYESRAGFTKMFNFNSPSVGKKDPQNKPKPAGLPPVLSTLLTPNSLENSFNLVDKEPRIKISYPVTDPMPKSRFYHTKTNSMPAEFSSEAPALYKRKGWKYSYYQTRHKVATPMEKTRMFLKESKNSPRAKLNSLKTVYNQKRREPRPDVDIEIKPYDG